MSTQPSPGAEPPKLRLRLTGVSGQAKGAEYWIEQGATATLGRSRTCDIRLGDPGAEGRDRDSRPDHLHSVSRTHARIGFQSKDRVVVEDLSRHGTFVNGTAVSGSCLLKELAAKPVELRLGTNDAFRLELCDTPPAKNAPRIIVRGH